MISDEINGCPQLFQPYLGVISQWREEEWREEEEGTVTVERFNWEDKRGPLDEPRDFERQTLDQETLRCGD